MEPFSPKRIKSTIRRLINGNRPHRLEMYEIEHRGLKTMCPSCSPFFLPRLHIDGIGADSSEKLSQFGTVSIFVRSLRDFVDFRSLTSEGWTHVVCIRNAVDGFELLGAVPLGGDTPPDRAPILETPPPTRRPGMVRKTSEFCIWDPIVPGLENRRRDMTAIAHGPRLRPRDDAFTT